MKSNSMLIHEVSIHYSRPILVSLNRVTNMEEACQTLKESIDLEKIDLKEFFWIMLLNHSNYVLGVAQIGSGTISTVAVNTKEIFQLAIKANAASIILCHNHPSGNLKPSRADINLTNKIIEAGKLMDIHILDHLIITSEGHVSLLEEGLI